jgi:cobalt-zinc-cadmium efflux system protein
MAHVHNHSQNHSHGHSHGHGHAREMGKRALWGALWLNLVYMGVEAAAGLWTGSLALLSDAAHMLSDVLALAVAIVAVSLAQSAIRGKYTYGLGRVGVLGGAINGLTALGLAVFIVLEAIERLAKPPEVQGLPVLIVAVLGLFVNLGSAFWLHRSGDKGVNARAAMLHMFADALGSIAAMVSGVVLMTTGWLAIDPIVSVLVAGIVAASALPLLRDAVNILLERAPAHVDLDRMCACVLEGDEVEKVLDLHAWELDSGEVVASIVVATQQTDLRVLTAAADRLREVLAHDFHVTHCTVEWRDGAGQAPRCFEIEKPDPSKKSGDPKGQAA